MACSTAPSSPAKRARARILNARLAGDDGAVEQAMEDAVAAGCPQLAEEAEAWLAGRNADRAGFLGGEPD
eukprot:10781584-Lingulodinium_polyedra.AAC.1